MRVDVGGFEVSVEIVGSGPRAVLFVHGLGASRTCWGRAPDFFDPERYRLILPDLPGFGESDAPEDCDYSMASLTAALEKTLAALGIDELHVVGHSMGGAVALLLAGSEQIRVRSFASAEGNLVPDDAFMSSKVSRLKEATLARVWTKFVGMVAQSLGDEPVETHQLFLASLRGTAPHALYRTSQSCAALTASGELSRRFVELACPKIYLVGEKTRAERNLPAPVVDSDAPVITIPGIGHFLMDKADAFYPTVRGHIERVETASS
jgi:pimeloyl-ACP methyl ester carboxylesterase